MSENWETEYYRMRSERDELLIRQSDSRYKVKYENIMSHLKLYYRGEHSYKDFVKSLWIYHDNHDWVYDLYRGRLKRRRRIALRITKSVLKVVLTVISKVVLVALWIVSLPLRVPAGLLLILVNSFLALQNFVFDDEANAKYYLKHVSDTWHRLILRNKWDLN